MGLLVGYARVSTELQNEARQKEVLESLGCEKIYIDKTSGKNRDRPALKDMMDFVREGDEIIVKEVSRFARNLKDLIELVDELTNKKVKIRFLDFGLDTESSIGKMFLRILGTLAEFERETIKERTMEGIAIAKKEGKYKGRKAWNIDKQKVLELLAQGYCVKQVCNKCGFKYTTFYKYFYKDKDGNYKAKEALK